MREEASEEKERYAKVMMASVNTIDQLRDELYRMGGSVVVKKGIDSSTQQELAACKYDLEQQREESRRITQAYEDVRKELGRVTAAQQRLRGEKLMVDLELQESRKKVEGLRETESLLRVELGQLRNRPAASETASADELEMARKSVTFLTGELAESQAHSKSLRDKLVTQEQVTRAAVTNITDKLAESQARIKTLSDNLRA